MAATLELTDQEELGTRSRGLGLWGVPWWLSSYLGAYPPHVHNLSDMQGLRVLWEGKDWKLLGWSGVSRGSPRSQGRPACPPGAIGRHDGVTRGLYGQPITSTSQNSCPLEGPARSACCPVRTGSGPLRPPSALQKGSVMFGGSSFHGPGMQVLGSPPWSLVISSCGAIPVGLQPQPPTPTHPGHLLKPKMPSSPPLFSGGRTLGSA